MVSGLGTDLCWLIVFLGQTFSSEASKLVSFAAIIRVLMQWEELCMMTLITAAKETMHNLVPANCCFQEKMAKMLGVSFVLFYHLCIKYVNSMLHM